MAPNEELQNFTRHQDKQIKDYKIFRASRERKTTKDIVGFIFILLLSYFLLLTKYNFGYKNKEVGVACSTYVGEESCIQSFVGKTRGRLLGSLRRR